jgi:hypothetical protein
MKRAEAVQCSGAPRRLSARRGAQQQRAAGARGGGGGKAQQSRPPPGAHSSHFHHGTSTTSQPRLRSKKFLSACGGGGGAVAGGQDPRLQRPAAAGCATPQATLPCSSQHPCLARRLGEPGGALWGPVQRRVQHRVQRPAAAAAAVATGAAAEAEPAAAAHRVAQRQEGAGAAEVRGAVHLHRAGAGMGWRGELPGEPPGTKKASQRSTFPASAHCPRGGTPRGPANWSVEWLGATGTGAGAGPASAGKQPQQPPLLAPPSPLGRLTCTARGMPLQQSAMSMGLG